VAYFNDSFNDANVSTTGGVTTVDFTSGTNVGQTVTTTGVSDLHFTDGTDYHG
jgi:hypothetical protein